MKKFLRNWLINGLAIAITGWVFPGLEVSYNHQNFLLASLILTIIIKIIKPVFEIVFLPLNLMTLGIFRWVRLIISFGITIYFANGLSLKSFIFEGISLNGIEIQPTNITSFLSLIIGSFLLFYIKKIVRWIFKTK